MKYVPEGEDRPRIAIETKRKWLMGEATDEELRAARDAAWAARDAMDAAWAATVASSASSASRATWPAVAATEHQAQCELIRKRIPAEVIIEAMK